MTTSPRLKITKFQTTLLYLLPAALFFSYHPRLPIGSTASMNLELSLPLIWLALFAASSLLTLPNSLRRLRQLFPRHPRLLLCLSVAFPLYTTISIAWSDNPLRAILTTGIIWCLYCSCLTIPNLITKNNIKKRIVKSTLISAVVVSGFCWLQSILDIFKVDPNFTLMCHGCTYRSFGFPHPNGFAIEPQFMGNLMLAPCFLALYLLFQYPKKRKTLLPVAFFLLTTLFFTFSRGAIYAFILGLVCLIVLQLIRTKKPGILLTLPLIGVAFVGSLLAQGTFAQLSPTNDTFTSGITKAISQLSLGHLNLPLETPANPSSEDSTPEEDKDAENQTNQTDKTLTSNFDGYVSESTEVRVRLTDYALDRWDDDTSLVFGTGIASSGTVLYRKFPTLGSAKEIVQNEYATLLLETGVVGCLLALIGFTIFVKYGIIKTTTKTQAFQFGLLVAYLASLFFFSGLPNALHIYLLPILGYSLSLTSSGRN